MISLRKATVEDLKPMMVIAHEGFKPHVEKVRPWVEADEVAGFIEHFTIADIHIIEVNNNAAGYIKVIELSDACCVEGIYISKAFRSQGLGTSIMTDLLAKANQPVTLRVFKENPAYRLYQRLGFQVMSESDGKVYMKYQK